MSVHTQDKTKDGRKWYFTCYYKDYTGATKQYKSKRYMTRKEAETEELLFKTKNENPSYIRFIVVANDYFKYMYSTRKESTVYSYENAYKKNILPYFCEFYINDINTLDINKWKEIMLKNGFKITYCNKQYNILKSIFDYAISNFDYKENPVSLCGRFEKVREEVVKDEEKLRYITLDQFNQFISVIEDNTWKTFFIFLYYTGMRKGEVQALTWNDINFDTSEIIVNKTLSVKTKEQYKITSTKNYINRKIKMSRTLKEALLTYKKEMMNYTDYKENWFVFGGSRFLPSTTIDNHKHKYFELSGVEEITCHEFRHSHVSLLINQYIKNNPKGDINAFFVMMSNRLGHSIKVMQETYMHLIPSVQDEIVDLLDNL